MDPLTINRLGNIRHQEIVAWSEQQQQMTTRRWKLPNLLRALAWVVSNRNTLKVSAPPSRAAD